MKIFGLGIGSNDRHKLQVLTTKLVNHFDLLECRNSGRSERRTSAAMGIRVTPCDERNHLDRAAAFDAATHNLSVDGLAFVHRRQFQAGTQLVIRIEHDRDHFALRGEVRHCRHIGSNLYITGVRFLGRDKELE